jgi:flagellar P-ring protein precursor FlgI
MKVDVAVSSVGDAKSIEGGVLLLTALRAPNGEVYAEAQGPLVIGGYSEGTAGNSKTVNHPTVGRIAEGATVERDAAVDLSRFQLVSLLLLNPDFTAARDIADVINKEFGKPIANALDSRRIERQCCREWCCVGANPHLAYPKSFDPFSISGQSHRQRTHWHDRDGR